MANSSICIVGGSRNLLASNLGSKIDSHDTVIRINHHPVGYEQDAGAKVDIWSVVTNAGHVARLIASGVPDFVNTIKELWITDSGKNEEFFRVLFDAGVTGNPIMRETAKAKYYLDEILSPAEASTGLTTIAYAISMYGPVNIAGFSQCNEDERGHYYDLKKPLWKGHDISREAKLIDCWEAMGLVQRIKP